MFGIGLVEAVFVIALIGIPLLIVAGVFASGRQEDEPVGERDVANETYNSGAWRDGALLVMRSDAILPDRCVKTNQPANGKRLKWTVYWHPGALYLILLASLPIYVIVALLVRKRATIRVGISQDVLRRRRIAASAGWSLGIGGVVLMIASGSLMIEWAMVLGFLMSMVGIVWSALGTRVVMPARIDGDYVWLRGVAPDFLWLLPVWADRPIP